MLANIDKMDANMLLSIINMRLRDQNPSLKDLCRQADIDEEKVNQRLNSIGYVYNKNSNQFKPSK